MRRNLGTCYKRDHPIWNVTSTHVWYNIGRVLHRRLLCDTRADEIMHVFADEIQDIQANATRCIVATLALSHEDDALWLDGVQIAVCDGAWILTPNRLVYGHRDGIFVYDFQTGIATRQARGGDLGYASDHNFVYHNDGWKWQDGSSAEGVQYFAPDGTLVPYGVALPPSPYWLHCK